MRIRTVRSGDWRAYRGVRLAALRESPSAFESTYEEEAAMGDERWRRRARSSEVSEDTTIALAQDDSKWVGLAAGYRPGHGADCELISLWVDPAARGRGLGARLVDAVASWAAGHGDRTIGLWVNDRNRAAISLYRRAGFEATGESKPMPADPSQTEMRMIGRITPHAAGGRARRP
jgi:ribosomal protein S18 acetylase RimI-like enzyme